MLIHSISSSLQHWGYLSGYLFHNWISRIWPYHFFLFLWWI